MDKEQDITEQKPKMHIKFAKEILEKTKTSKKEITLQDSMEMQEEEEKNLNMLLNLWRSKKQNIPMVY